MCYTRTMNLEILITQSQKNLSDMDLEILAYVVKHHKQVQNANIIDLSKAVHVSKSSVLRMTKKLGFSGYTEFKYFLKKFSRKPFFLVFCQVDPQRLFL